MIPDFTCPRACTLERGRVCHFSEVHLQAYPTLTLRMFEHPSHTPSLFHRNVLLVFERFDNSITMSQARSHLVQLHQAVCLRFVLPYLLRPWALFHLILVDLVLLEHLHPNSCRVATASQNTVTSLRSLAPNV